MAQRLLESKTRMTDRALSLAAYPSIPTGTLTDNTVVKDEPGLLTGYTIEAISTEGDLTVEVWDMDQAMVTAVTGTPNAVTHLRVARLTLRTTTIGDMASWSTPNECGVECEYGIYFYMTGDGEDQEEEPEYIVHGYYK